MAEIEEVDEPSLISFPLLRHVEGPSSEPDGELVRTGTVRTATAHLITGVIGSGVLTLAWSMAQLGWIAGPICMLVFGIITIVSSNILCDCYIYLHPQLGNFRNKSYAKAVKRYIGRKNMWVVAVFLHESFYAFGIAYTIAAGNSMRAILKSNCYHKQGHNAPCTYGDSWFMVFFGAVQLVVSLIPNFHRMELLSIVTAVMSFAYTFIALALGFAKVIGNGQIKGSISGVAASSPAHKVFLVLQALGNIAFSFNYNIILLDIQDTIRGPPEINNAMKKASVSAILITSFFFLSCGCFGYAAFGDETPGNLLSGFGFYEPYWLVNIANVCIVLHLVGAYQIHSQALFAAVQRQMLKIFPNCLTWVHTVTVPEVWNPNLFGHEYTIPLPLVAPFTLTSVDICYKSAYVVSTTALSIVFPYFNQILGVLGVLNFWPLVIYFPIQMYIEQKKVPAWSSTWILLQALKAVCLLCAVSALVGLLLGHISSEF